MSKKLYVGNFSFELDESTLETFINSHGVEITSLKIIRDRETGRSRGFGFAELPESSQLEQAIAALDGKEFHGRAITVSEARDKPNNNRQSGGGFSNRW